MLCGLWFLWTLFLSLIYQSSVRSSLLVISYEPEVNNMQDAIDYLDILYSPHVKVADIRDVSIYKKESASLYGDKFFELKKVCHTLNCYESFFLIALIAV